jgi:hypothetical protein
MIVVSQGWTMPVSERRETVQQIDRSGCRRIRFGRRTDGADKFEPAQGGATTMAKTMRHAFGAALKIAAPPVSLVNRSGLPIARINQPKTSSNDAGCFERGE